MKVLLVDDHPLVLNALQALIHRLDPAIAVLTAETPQEGFALLAQDGGVELLLLDLNLGQGVDGFAVLAALRERHPALPVVVVSATERLGDMVRAIDMGAMGFVPKRSPTAGLSDALALVLSGGVYIPPALLGLARQPGMSLAAAAAAADAAASQVAARWLAEVTGAATPPVLQAVAPPAAPVGPAPPAGAAGAGLTGRAALAALGLTPRQTDVLVLLLKGLPNKLIARELHLSVETVKDHVAAVLRTLGVGSRTQAVLAVSRLTQPDAAPRG